MRLIMVVSGVGGNEFSLKINISNNSSEINISNNSSEKINEKGFVEKSLFRTVHVKKMTS